MTETDSHEQVDVSLMAALATADAHYGRVTPAERQAVSEWLHRGVVGAPPPAPAAGHPLLRRMWEDRRGPPLPDTQVWNLAVDLACGCRIFKVRQANWVYRPLLEGMIGFLAHVDMYGIAPPRLEWGVDFRLGGGLTHDVSPWVPVHCLEPAGLDELMAAKGPPVSAKAVKRRWNAMYGPRPKRDSPFAALSYGAELCAPDADTHARNSAMSTLEDLRVSLAEFVARIEDGSIAELAVARRQNQRISKALGGVRIYPGHADLVARFVPLRAQAVEAQRKLGRLVRPKPAGP